MNKQSSCKWSPWKFGPYFFEKKKFFFVFQIELTNTIVYYGETRPGAASYPLYTVFTLWRFSSLSKDNVDSCHYSPRESSILNLENEFQAAPSDRTTTNNCWYDEA